MPRRTHPSERRRPQKGLGDKRGRHKKAVSKDVVQRFEQFHRIEWRNKGEAA